MAEPSFDPPPAAGPSVTATYVVGEDSNRLRRTAAEFGLSSARLPLKPVREAVTSFFSDHTLEAARMHSVGTVATDERVDEGGTIHLMTLSRRRKGQTTGGIVLDDKSRPEYENLMDLFQKPMEVEPTEISEEEEEFEVLDTVEGGSLTAAVFGIIKGTIGPAILYLPRGFKQAGWAVAIPALICSTATYLYSAWRLLQCWSMEKKKVEKIEEIRALLEEQTLPASKQQQYNAIEEGESLTNKTQQDPFGDCGTLLTYPELARRSFGSYASFITSGIAAMQFGVCLTYLIFVPQNFVECTRVMSGVSVPSYYFLIAMVLIEMPLCWIRDIRKLTTTNILATLLIAYGLVSCLAIALFWGDAQNYNDDDSPSNLLKKISNLEPLNDTWYLFIGTSFFVFEGSITLVVPLQEAVFTPEDKKRFPTVNNYVTLCIVAFYIFFAIICWASFGDNVKTALTASLPAGTISTSVQIAYSIAVIFTFPLQAFPALEVACHTTQTKAGDKHHRKEIVKRNITASLIICCLGVIAYLAIDYLGNVVSILGSLVGIPIALIYPNLMHNVLSSRDTSSSALYSWKTRAMNYFVAGLGLFATIAATYTTLAEWDKGAE